MAQREAYARLLTAAHDYQKAAQSVLWMSTVMDAGRVFEQDGAELMAAERFAEYRRRITAVNDEGLVRAAAQQVELEGPAEVGEAARRVQKAATDLARVLVLAGLSDPGEDIPPNPQRSETLHEALLTEVEQFTHTARDYLNRRDHPAGEEPAGR
ncbi:hypothetical protein [Streptomyces sp. NRRL S-87]|uniref:hypothetical protein n=1 Tax=Streptomyces sp. NRRL S-87 TaxID=1463920 RepID=UPI0004BFDF91|nr:hypothetical protein [Streptomyces sp. NRRL S-87]